MEIKVGDEVRLNQYALKLGFPDTSPIHRLLQNVGKTRTVISVSPRQDGIYYSLLYQRWRFLWVHESQLEKKITLDNGKTIYVSLSNKR